MVINQNNIEFTVYLDNSIYITDTSEYSENDYMMFEWISSKNEIISYRNCPITEYTSWHTSSFEDGLYTFTKIVLNSTENIEALQSNEGKLGWCLDEGVVCIKQYVDNKWIDVEDLDAAYKIMFDKYEDNEQSTEGYFYTPSQLFLLGNVKKCLVSLQKQYICDSLGAKCVDSVKSRRDFLHSAIEVLEYLSNTGNYEEAQRILDNISECGFLCKDVANHITRCNCG